MVHSCPQRLDINEHEASKSTIVLDISAQTTHYMASASIWHKWPLRGLRCSMGTRMFLARIMHIRDPASWRIGRSSL